ncbi:3-hydroxyacyl-CoA dehydrogenase [Zoogloeaceae bacterium G21618-S1]|nr:3-hydroxyacyl-CoA dehydrogenase [Zoogloeaceae bacterium G21618-S1]
MNTARSVSTLGIVGAGLMGQGIAQIAALGGVNVLLFDTRTSAAADAIDLIGAMLTRLVEKGRLTESERAAALTRLRPVANLGGVADCDAVVEAIVEDLDAKRVLMRELESVVADNCILATNTSSLSVTAIAAACARPDRVAGFHFFSPVPLMKVVEVIDGARTDAAVSECLVELARRMGHAPVRAQDTPGFIVNHAGRAYVTEGLRILGEGVTDAATLDRVLRDAAGFRMGPCELLDLTGLDVSHPVMTSIYDQYFQEPRYRPSPMTRQRLAAGLLGRKSGQGFYTYVNGVARIPPECAAPSSRPARVFVAAADPAVRANLIALVRRLGGVLDEGERPADDALCVVAPAWGEDATTACLAHALEPLRTIAIDLFSDETRRRTLMRTPLTDPARCDEAHGLFATDGVPVSVIRDSTGFITQRVLAMIVNLGCDIAQQRIASPGDIDTAVQLGLGYPAGPLALGDRLGPQRVLDILDRIETFTRDPRYRPSPWLIRRARLGVSLLTPDA